MSHLTTPLTRLPLRIQSLVSLTSILIRIRPISSLHTSQQPIRSFYTPTTHSTTPSPAHTRPTQASGVLGKNLGRSQGCPVTAEKYLNHPIGSQYMCGNSYSSMASSSPVVIQPTGTHSATVIFLHGLGDQGYGWKAGFEEIKEPHIKYIFPHAPAQPVTLNAGMVMPSWFDITSLEIEDKEDDKGIENSSGFLLQLVAAEEAKGISPDRIVIGGFSQGGAVSLFTALSNERKFAGVVALSTWMPLVKRFKTQGITKKSLPILQCHGNADPVINFKFGGMTHDFLQTQVNNPEFKAFPGLGHSSNMEEMMLVRDFLKKILP